METAYLSAVIEDLKGQIEELNNKIVILEDRERELIYEINLRESKYDDLSDRYHNG